MKLWSSRFEKNTAALTDELNASIGFDCRLYRQDILGSLAHCAMLRKTGIITGEDAEKIIRGLNEILADMVSGALTFGQDAEDVHMAIEGELTRRIGKAGGRLHTARSRNDQVALDLRLYLKEEITTIRTMALALLEALADIAAQNLDTVMPAYTHLQRAQPTTFAHVAMAYANMLRRDILRLEDCLERMDECPLGSGAATSTTYPIDRAFVAEALGFARVTQNSMDAVSDRDFSIELMSDLSILMMHLSRFSEEIILWCSWEFRFAELDDAYSTGSSIMPQKKNPDIAELVRGKTGRIYGDLITLLTVMKGLPLAYNKDMQEDKEPVFDACDTVKKCLPVFTDMLLTMKLLPENMRRAAAGGFINATDCADYLTKRGLPFREAYGVVGALVKACSREGKTLETLTLEEYRQVSPLFESDIFDAISLERCVGARRVPGGPAPESVLEQIAYIRSFISERTQD
ncbi:MAG: argininosuccinate lyase [Oscillospiraceae bacterium]|nr:argininosuccinate lyase [Oscillospiraceae bacterium]